MKASFRAAVLGCFALASACSSSVSAFVGTWTVSGNASVISGAGGYAQTYAGGANNYSIVFTAGQMSDLESIDSYGCKLQWSVSGSTATLEPSQSCTIPASGQSWVLNASSGVASLTVVDATHLSGTANLGGTYGGAGILGPPTTTCTTQATGTLTMVPAK
jgi:hypothetical protein